MGRVFEGFDAAVERTVLALLDRFLRTQRETVVNRHARERVRVVRVQRSGSHVEAELFLLRDTCE